MTTPPPPFQGQKIWAHVEPLMLLGLLLGSHRRFATKMFLKSTHYSKNKMSFQGRDYSSPVVIFFHMWAHTEQHRSVVKVDGKYVRLITLNFGQFRNNVDLKWCVIVMIFYLVFKCMILKSAQKCPRLYLITSLREWQFWMLKKVWGMNANYKLKSDNQILLK